MKVLHRKKCFGDEFVFNSKAFPFFLRGKFFGEKGKLFAFQGALNEWKSFVLKFIKNFWSQLV